MTGVEDRFGRVRTTRQVGPEPGGADRRHQPVELVLVHRVGRVDEHEVERPERIVISGDKRKRVRGDDLRRLREPGPGEVVADRAERGPVPLDQRRVLGAPRQRLDRHRAGPAYRSRTRVPRTPAPRLENTPSRALSETGRTPRGTGPSRTPLAVPAITLTSGTASRSTPRTWTGVPPADPALPRGRDRDRSPRRRGRGRA